MMSKDEGKISGAPGLSSIPEEPKEFDDTESPAPAVTEKATSSSDAVQAATKSSALPLYEKPRFGMRLQEGNIEITPKDPDHRKALEATCVGSFDESKGAYVIKKAEKEGGVVVDDAVGIEIKFKSPDQKYEFINALGIRSKNTKLSEEGKESTLCFSDHAMYRLRGDDHKFHYIDPQTQKKEFIDSLIKKTLDVQGLKKYQQEFLISIACSNIDSDEEYKEQALDIISKSKNTNLNELIEARIQAQRNYDDFVPVQTAPDGAIIIEYDRNGTIIMHANQVEYQNSQSCSKLPVSGTYLIPHETSNNGFGLSDDDGKISITFKSPKEKYEFIKAFGIDAKDIGLSDPSKPNILQLSKGKVQQLNSNGKQYLSYKDPDIQYQEIVAKAADKDQKLTPGEIEMLVYISSSSQNLVTMTEDIEKKVYPRVDEYKRYQQAFEELENRTDLPQNNAKQMKESIAYLQGDRNQVHEQAFEELKTKRTDLPQDNAKEIKESIGYLKQKAAKKAEMTLKEKAIDKAISIGVGLARKFTGKSVFHGESKRHNEKTRRTSQSPGH